MTKRLSLLQMTLALGLALGTGACSTLSDLDPTGLLGDDDSTPAADQSASAPPTSDADQGTTPDLASIPARPANQPTAQQQQAATQSLAADGAQAQYSADALRAGTEAASAAPPPPSAPAVAVASAQPPAPSAADNAPPTAGAEDNAPPTATPPAAVSAARPVAAATPPRAPAPAPSEALAQGTEAVAPAAAEAASPRPAQAPTAETAALPPPAAAPASAAPPAAAPAAQAVALPPPSGEPAVPAVPASGTRGVATAAMAPSDAQLGFRPSSAPALNPSVSRWVPAPVIAQYRQTASVAGTPGVGVPAVPAKGAVVSDMPGAVSVTGGAVTPTEIIYFASDGTRLSAAGRAKVRAAVQQFKALGGVGTIRVVGHSSSRTADMPLEKHLEVIFQKSQARASAVAQELIHEGVPASKVLIDAVGDSQPVYYESMPKGEEGNRRAEIFVQG